MRHWGYAAKSAVLGTVRRGPRTVLWAPAWMGFGNWLYLWLWADVGREAGEDRSILRHPGMDPWLQAFPALEGLSITRGDVRLRDRRHMNLRQHGRFGDSFTRVDLESFVTRRLLTGPGLDGPATSPSEVVVNVRRGDYYSNAAIAAEFGFDQVSYVRRATDAVLAAGGAPSAFVVVSDDPAWCRENLAWLADRAEVRFAPRDGPVSDFRAVATARRAVLTNSTFSYWGGYVSGVLHGGDSQVWAPSFFSRRQEGARPWHLDPRWHVVEVDPGAPHEHTAAAADPA